MHAPTFSQWKHFIILFVPLLFTQLAQIGASVFSSIFSGQAGTIDLAGVAVGVNLWYPVFAGMCGLFFGISPTVAQLRGAQKTSRIPIYIMQSLYISIFFSFLIALVGYALVPSILIFMDLEPAVHEIAKGYMIVLSLGILPMFLQATMRYVVDAHGKTHVSMAILLINLALTILFFYLFIFGKCGFPALGGVGTAYALTLAAWLSFALFALVFQFMEPFKSYRLWHHLWPFNWIHCQNLLRLGVPIFIAVFCETSLFSIVGLLMAEFGTVYLAANQAAISYSTLVYCIPWSVSLAATIVVGYEVGAKAHEKARQYALVAQGTAFFLAGLTAIMTFVFKNEIARLFTNDPLTFSAIYTFLLYGICYSFFDAAGAPVQGILRGYKDVKIITYVAFITYWLISIPMGIALAHLTTFGPYGYWLGLIIALAINATALNTRLWKHTAWS